MERVLSWALALTLSALLLAVTLQDLLGPTPNAVFGLLALRSGIELFEPVGRNLVAGAQLVAVALLLWPRGRSWGAGLALLIAVGAVIVHMTPWLGVVLPQPEQASAALAAGADAAEVAALPTDKGGMFLVALAIAVLSGSALFAERAKVRALAPRTKRPAGAYA